MSEEQRPVVSDAVAAAVNGALEAAVPIVVSYIGLDERPRVSFRGSVQVVGPSQLAIWIRSSTGGFLAAIAVRPAVTLMYHNPSTREMFHLYGDARLDATPETRERLYAMMPARERERDADKAGEAVIIDLGRITYGPYETDAP